MLKPSYFDGKSELVEKYYRDLEDYLLNDIARFLLQAGELGGKADRELFVLQQMGLSNAAITSKLAQISSQSKSAVREVLQGSVMTSFSNDKEVLEKYFDGDFAPLDNPTIIPVMDAEWQKTCGELDNLTRTTMAQYNMDVVNLLNEAEMQVATGMSSYSAAVCDVLDKYAAKGMIIDYPTGARRSLEAAVRCCVVTSMNQTAAQVTNKYIAEGGIEYVLVSAHEGARHSNKGGLFSHDGWQGKAYKIRGSEDGYPNLLESTGYDIDPNTGEGQVVNPAGLHGYNCRHSHSPWDKGLENPWLDENGKPRVDPQKSREKYEQQQTQRGMERSIRQTKRQLNMKQSELDLLPKGSIEHGKAQAEYDRLAYKLRQKNMKYGEFCADHNLTQQADRVKVAGWTKAESQKANGRAKAYVNSVDKPKNLRGDMNKVEYVPRREYNLTANRLNKELDSFTNIPSMWNGQVSVDKKLSANEGLIGLNNEIILGRKASVGSFIHELLHQRSWVYDVNAFMDFRNMEEATVQLFTEEICKTKDYAFAYTYRQLVEPLREIRKLFPEYDTDLEFARALFEKPLAQRYGWLYNKAKESNGLSKEIELCFDKLSGGSLGL